MHKTGIGDYPLKDYPCEHWWVRYSTSCTLLADTYKKVWEPKIKELLKKHNVTYNGHKGIFKLKDCHNKEDMEAYMEREIIITKNGEEIRLREDDKNLSDLFDTMSEYVSRQPGWTNCPYQNDKQSKCPFYEKDEHYGDTPLKELRTLKGGKVE